MPTINPKDRPLDNTVRDSDTLITLLRELIVLARNVGAAYQAAVDRMSDSPFKARVGEHAKCYREHAAALERHVLELGAEPIPPEKTKRPLVKSKVVIAGLIGDGLIGKALASDDDELIAWYERVLRQQGVPEPVRQTLQTNLAKTRQHRRWLAERLQSRTG